jgi:DnaJ-class molecular chaperone
MATRKKVGVSIESLPNHYQVMGLHRSSKPEEVKARWRQLSWELHPDRAGGDSDKYAAVTSAYAVLGDPKIRAEYNARLDITTAPCATCKGQGCTWKQKGFTQKTAAVCGTCQGTGRVAR